MGGHKTEKRALNYTLTPSRKLLGKSLARGSWLGIARHCLNHPRFRRYLMANIGRILRSQMSNICSDRSSSKLGMKSAESLFTFSWDELYEEFQQQAPDSVKMMEQCTKTKKIRRNKKNVITICI